MIQRYQRAHIDKPIELRDERVSLHVYRGKPQ